MKRLLKRTAITLVVMFLATGLFFFVPAAFAYADDSDGPIPETMSSVLSSDYEEATSRENASSIRLADTRTPQAGSLQKDWSLFIWRPGDSWSFANSFFSLVGLAETLIAIGIFFRRNNQCPPNLLCPKFLFIALSLLLVVVALIGTIITSDFTKSPAVFDRMSVSIIILFAAQQAVLFAMKKAQPTPSSKKERGHFRAMRRFEG
jgi:hypothetical protein